MARALTLQSGRNSATVARDDKFDWTFVQATSSNIMASLKPQVVKQNGFI